jgi:8-oxo-dGTP diphosphatase
MDEALSRPDILEVYTVSILTCADEVLLIQRAANKAFAPLRWSGLGGHVESDEFQTLRASALPEVWEESGIAADDIQDFALRRVLLNNRPGPALRVILYYTGRLTRKILPDGRVGEADGEPEGELHWLRPEQFDTIDIIETTRQVLACLVEDIRRDPTGRGPVVTGLGVFSPQGEYQGITWGINDPGCV